MNKFVSVEIDLGTTYSCAFFNNECKCFEVVKNQFSSRTTPLCFTRNDIRFGQAAINQGSCVMQWDSWVLNSAKSKNITNSVSPISGKQVKAKYFSVMIFNHLCANYYKLIKYQNEINTCNWWHILCQIADIFYQDSWCTIMSIKLHSVILRSKH
jgi:molecular chaperone DnaK (HSP70)